MQPTHADLVLVQLDRALRRWLLVGLLLVIVLPLARGHHHWIGWLPYWLVVAPALSLALLHRGRLAGGWRQRPPAARRRRSGRQAARSTTGRRARPLLQRPLASG